MRALRILVLACFVWGLGSTARAGEWVKNSVTNAGGTRAFELYVPEGIQKNETRPLLVAIHGCTQAAADFAGLARTARLADQARILVLHPSQTPLANPSLCWNWFLEANQKREGEPSLIVAMVDWVRKRYRVDEKRIYVMGVSSGGYMTSILLSCYADVFAAGAVACGGMYEGARDVIEAVHTAGHGSAMDPDAAGADAFRCSGSVHPRAVPTLVFDGSEDPYVVAANGKQVVAQFVQVNDLGDDGSDNDSIGIEPSSTGTAVSAGGLPYTWSFYGGGLVRHYVVNGMGHAWSGGDPAFAYADPRGPDETAIIWSFLREYRRESARSKRRAAAH